MDDGRGERQKDVTGLYRMNYDRIFVKERIVGVAIRTDRAVWFEARPSRHSHLIRAMAAHGLEPEDMIDQGFLTNKARFVDRKEGLRIAREAGQVAEKRGNQDFLFSEDLW